MGGGSGGRAGGRRGRPTKMRVKQNPIKSDFFFFFMFVFLSASLFWETIQTNWPALGAGGRWGTRSLINPVRPRIRKPPRARAPRVPLDRVKTRDFAVLGATREGRVLLRYMRRRVRVSMTCGADDVTRTFTVRLSGPGVPARSAPLPPPLPQPLPLTPSRKKGPDGRGVPKRSFFDVPNASQVENEKK